MRLQFFSPKVQWYISVLFPFILLPEEQRQTHFHGIDTVHKGAFFFRLQCFCCSFFFDLLDCSWSDLLFISAMIKPFEFIKVLVSSVCTVPNARNTRRSTALGETPLIWYCARYPGPSNPAVVSVSVGCGCGTQRGSVHCCVPSVTFQYSLPHAQFNSCFFLFADFSQQFQRDWRPGRNPSFEKG